jgi:hypothetical protein
MPLNRLRTGLLGAFVLLLLRASPAVADVPSWLPQYDLDMKLDVAGHSLHVRERVTWTNRHDRPTEEIVFNAHSHYQVPGGEVPFMAKMLEILRMTPGDSLENSKIPPPLQIR